MWIEETKSGKFKFTEQYTDYMTGKKKRVSVTLPKNTAAAKKSAASILVRMIEEKQSVPKQNTDITLGELIKEYLQHQKLVLKVSSYNSTYYLCNAILKIFDKDIKVANISPIFLKETLIRTGKPNGYLNNIRNRMVAIFHWGYDNDYIADISFVSKLKPFKDKTHREKIEDKFLEPKELETLLKGFKNKKWELLTHFLTLSGLRIGEALSLETQDIDFANHVIHITKTIFPAFKSVDTPKTLSSVRDVYIQPELEAICRDIILFIKQEGLFRGYRTNLFICNTRGDYVSYIVYSNVLKKTSLELLGREITPHVLRHTHASLLLANGMSTDAISRRLGHENSEITRQVYLHVTEKLKKQEQEQIKKIHLIG
ncbi:MAG: tyrosine-type recombinase/integrase [Blautia hansenii]